MANVFGPVFGPTFGTQGVAEELSSSSPVAVLDRPRPTPKPPELQVLIRDANRVVQDELAHTVPYTVEATLRANYADDWTVSYPAQGNGRYTNLLHQPGIGVILVAGNDVLTSGPLRSGQIVGGADGAMVTVSGMSDTEALASHFAWPVPGAAPNAQTVAHYMWPAGPATLPAETVLLRMITDQAGAGARVDLRIPGLVVPASLGRGPQRRMWTRFDPLMDMLRVLAADDLVFRIVQDSGTALRVDVRVPRDVSQSVAFSADLGSLPDYTTTWQAPTATRAIVAGGGLLVDRLIREYADTAAETAWAMKAWTFVDRRDVNPTDDPDYETTLATAGAEALAEGTAQASLTCDPVGLPGGPLFAPSGDYWLGDLVGVEVEGVATTERLRAMKVSYGSDGTVYQPIVGGPAAADPTPVEVREIRKLQALILRLLASQ